MKTDPPRRRDGRCARWGCSKRLPTVTKQLRRYAGFQIDRDPFCSATCARAFHGVSERQGSRPHFAEQFADA